MCAFMYVCVCACVCVCVIPTALLTGVLTAGILLICGVKLAIMFGILAFLLNYIPNFGSLIAMMLPIPIILVDENLNFNTKVIAAVVPALVQGYIGNVLEPAVFGSSLNMTPLSILMALVVWMSLWCVQVLSAQLNATSQAHTRP